MGEQNSNTKNTNIVDINIFYNSKVFLKPNCPFLLKTGPSSPLVPQERHDTRLGSPAGSSYHSWARLVLLATRSPTMEGQVFSHSTLIKPNREHSKELKRREHGK